MCPQLVKKLPAIYKSPRATIVFTTACRYSCPQTHQFSRRRISSKIYFNVILPSTSVFSKCFLSFRFPYRYSVCFSILSYIPTRLTQHISLHSSCHLLPLISKRHPQHPFLEHPVAVPVVTTKVVTLVERVVRGTVHLVTCREGPDG